MKVNTNGQEYRVSWKHYLRSSNSLAEPNVPGTSCTIEDPNGNVLVYGDSVLHPNDRFDKEIGRKTSLQFALEKLFPYPEGGRQLFPSLIWSRFAFWRAYFNRKGK